MSLKWTTTLLAGGALLASASAFAQHATNARFGGGLPPANLEHAAMDNLVAEALAQRTGRSQSELLVLLEKSPPPEVAQQVGVDDATMRSVFDTAHTSLIQRAQAAGLITTAQAQELKSAPRLQGGPPPDGPGFGAQ
jgi:hypothetical protein